jgi:hypothetical protein
MTPQSVTIVIFKKDVTARDWPDLSKTALPYVKADLSQWTREGDECDDAEADCSADIIDMDMDSSSAGTKSGVLLQVSTLRIDFMVYAFANENKSQINAQPHLASQRRQLHESCGRSKVRQLKG